MTTSTIPPPERRQIARDFLATSDHEFEIGDVQQGAEKLWGAAAHAIMVVAQEREWPYQSHRSLKNAAIKLANEREDPLIEAHFAVAEKCHIYFYHGIMEEWELDADRRLARDFVLRVLALS